MSCTGLFADIRHMKNVQPTSTTTNDLEVFDHERRLKFKRLLAQYKKYKADFVESILFEPFNFFTGYSMRSGEKANYSM